MFRRCKITAFSGLLQIFHLGKTWDFNILTKKYLHHLKTCCIFAPSNLKTYTVMKTKIFLLGLLVLPFTFVSCYHGASDEELRNYLTTMLPYYPYTMSEKFVFVNDTTGKIWECKPYDYYKDGLYPHTHILSCKEPLADCYGDWDVAVEAPIQPMDSADRLKYGFSMMKTRIVVGRYQPWIGWDIQIRFESDQHIYSIREVRTREDIYSFFTDTIIVPIECHVIKSELISPTEGAYARVVKNQGLTDFSVDGKSVWRRKKE